MACCRCSWSARSGVSALALGLIEGIAEATASISKIFSGALSDRSARASR